ncbi:glycoprotein 3-alpha-L-fucosyltransferase A [Hydra vulgaris]|uniref:glycoprotein 3-alpha-L-fucosyltransferase A n=1 Tax=Hydra vulgaris TaxID=6087 RepID=UPI001F5F4190|nr:glycoprotein 3-alpha-L-fucosyltransferase A-like [Hydra vulgaris]
MLKKKVIILSLLFLSIFVYICHLAGFKNEIFLILKPKSVQIYPNWLTNYSNFNVQNKIVILIYTEKFNWKIWHAYPFPDYSTSCGCNFQGCQLTYDKNLFNQSQAVIFNAKDLPPHSLLEQLERKKTKQQLFIYYTKENPINVQNFNTSKQFFNLFSTYRLDSDIRIPYRYHFSKQSFYNNVNLAKNKTKQIAWVVSNCGQLRDKLANKLQEYGVNIYVAGACSQLYKHRFHCYKRNCNSELKKFKFYFAAENHLCKDYITEKYWYNALNAETIPIVLGGANYFDSRLAIPNSFIDATKFATVKDLANFIKKVDNDDKKFNDFFTWKKHWELSNEKKGCSYYMCNLCQQLHAGINKKISEFVFTDDDCKTKEDHFNKWIEFI